MKATVSKVKKQLAGKFVTAVRETAEKAAGATCWFTAYQPKVPSKLQK